jgi:hypothetical protein
MSETRTTTVDEEEEEMECLVKIRAVEHANNAFIITYLVYNDESEEAALLCSGIVELTRKRIRDDAEEGTNLDESIAQAVWRNINNNPHPSWIRILPYIELDKNIRES